MKTASRPLDLRIAAVQLRKPGRWAAQIASVGSLDLTQNLDNETEGISVPRTYTVKDLCRQLHLSRPSVYKLAKKKDFPAVTVGRCILVDRQKLEEWIHEQWHERG